MRDDDTRTIFDALRRIVRDLRLSTDRGGALGPARLFIMQLIAEHGPLGVGALATRTHTSAPSVSVVVRHLVEAELLVRNPSPDDHRRHVLALTRKGRAALKKAPAVAQHQLDLNIAALSTTERRSLARLLLRVAPGKAAPLFFEEQR